MHKSLAPDLVADIRFAAADGQSARALARRHGIHVSTVNRVLTGDRHAAVDGPVRARRGRLSAGSPVEEIRAELVRRLTTAVTVTAAGCWLVGPAGTRPTRIEIGGRSFQARRLAFEALIGPLPSATHLEHGCMRWQSGDWHGLHCQGQCAACVRPDHAVVLIGRRVRLQRAASTPPAVACPHGHPVDVANARYRHESCGGWARVCRSCDRLSAAARRHKHPTSRTSPTQGASQEAMPTSHRQESL